MIATEVMPMAAQIMLKEFLEKNVSGQFILHIKDGKPMVSEVLEKTQLRLDSLTKY